MTALPSPKDFSTTMGTSAANGEPMHPDIYSRFWGYEVRMRCTGRASARLARIASVLSAVVASTIGLGLGLWAIEMLGTDRFWPLLAMAAAFLAVGFFAGHLFVRFRDIRVQVDTTAGELREVTPARFVKETVLARYGMDAVKAVEVVASQSDPAFGQVHVAIAGYGIVPVGDGAVSALRPLRDRLAVDCGLEHGSVRDAEWNGPLE